MRVKRNKPRKAKPPLTERLYGYLALATAVLMFATALLDFIRKLLGK